MTTRAGAIARAAARLAGAGVPEPERDARLLFRWAAGLDGAELTAALAMPANAAELARFDRAVERREAREPLSHITGRRAFWTLSVLVDRRVLDPRPETEALVAAALDGPAPRRLLDLGTGSGCILAALLTEWPAAVGVGTDISDDALAVAQANLDALGLAPRATLAKADWLDGVDGTFDLIVSNPPYIAEAEIPGLAPEVRDHEPRLALTPGVDGLEAYRAISGQAARGLAAGGRLIVETGAGQADAVGNIFRANGLSGIRHCRDLDGRARVVVAHHP